LFADDWTAEQESEHRAGCAAALPETQVLFFIDTSAILKDAGCNHSSGLAAGMMPQCAVGVRDFPDQAEWSAVVMAYFTSLPSLTQPARQRYTARDRLLRTEMEGRTAYVPSTCP
jgi:hypothetical protein